MKIEFSYEISPKMLQFIPQWMMPKLTEENGVNLPTGIWPGLPLWLCMTSVPLFVSWRITLEVCWETWALVASRLCLMETTNGDPTQQNVSCTIGCFYENYQHGIDIIPITIIGLSWCKTHSVIAHNEAPLSAKPWDINPCLTSLCKMWFCRRNKQQQRTSPLTMTGTSLR